MAELKAILVVKANGEMRILKGNPRNYQRPKLNLDEVGFRITVNIPDSWGRIVEGQSLTMPPPPDEALLSQMEKGS